jgi:tryptophan-rich sensory protein
MNMSRLQQQEQHQPPAIMQLVALVGLLAFCFGAAALGAALTAGSVNAWYPTLRKPLSTPPDWVFGPVWTVLYFLMALAAWLVWRKRGLGLPLALFAVQLLLNVGWSAVFFGLRRPGWAFVEIVVLWLAIAATTVSFWRVSRPAGLMLVPYWAWTLFAAVLNGTIWWMNR